MIGIYKITCTKNNKIYIGSSKNIKNRIHIHKKSLCNNNHRNKFLQNAWNKYGEINFLLEVVEECDIDNLLNREEYWINTTNSYLRDYGFNICKIPNSPLGYKHTDENKLKMSLIKKRTTQKWVNKK
jgi:group I intron endonuclease